LVLLQRNPTTTHGHMNVKYRLGVFRHGKLTSYQKSSFIKPLFQALILTFLALSQWPQWKFHQNFIVQWKWRLLPVYTSLPRPRILNRKLRKIIIFEISEPYLVKHDHFLYVVGIFYYTQNVQGCW